MGGPAARYLLSGHCSRAIAQRHVHLLDDRHRIDDDGFLGAREGFTKGWHKRMTKALPGAGMLLLRMISAP